MTLSTDAKKHLTVEQVLQHPSYSTAVWSFKPSQAGLLPVAAGRGGPIKISWEVHGTGDIKLVWVMGLGAMKSAWQRQTFHFGHEQPEKYSCLVIDNRGVGKSDKPIMRYSTSEIAKDYLEILEHLGWTSERQLHVLGVSMGGMIAQEIAYAVPNRICSLSLLSTAARVQNTISWVENLQNRVSMFIPKSLERTIADASVSMFPQSWLSLPDGTRVPTAAAPNVILPPSGAYGMFSSNYERFAAQELTKRLGDEFPKSGFIMQAIAAGWHYKSAAQLKEIGDKVGRERIMVMHGTADRLLTLPHGLAIIEELKPGTSYIREGAGHVLMIEQTEWHDGVVTELISKTEAMRRN